MTEEQRIIAHRFTEYLNTVNRTGVLRMDSSDIGILKRLYFDLYKTDVHTDCRVCIIDALKRISRDAKNNA